VLHGDACLFACSFGYAIMPSRRTPGWRSSSLRRLHTGCASWQGVALKACCDSPVAACAFFTYALTTHACACGCLSFANRMSLHTVPLRCAASETSSLSVWYYRAVLCSVNALAGSGKSSILRLLQLLYPQMTIL
jgi:hypothetical protein